MFKSQGELIGYVVIILGFILAWANINILGYLAVGLGLLISTYLIWKNPEIGIYMTIFFLPLTKTVNLLYFGTKIAVPEVLFGVTLTTYLIKNKLDFTKIKESYFIFLGLFILFSFISIINTSSLLNWAVEVISYIYLAIFFIFFSIALDTKKKINKAIKILLLSLGIVVVLGFIGYVFYLFKIQNPFVQGFRVSSTFKAINQLSISLFVGFFLLLNQSQIQFYKNKKNGALLTILSFLAVIVFFASGSRMTILVLIPMTLIYLGIYFFLYNKKIPWVGIAVFILIISLIFIPLDISRNYASKRVINSIQEMTSLDNIKEKINAVEGEVNDTTQNNEENKIMNFIKNTDSSRYHQIVAFSNLFPQHPFVGIGAGNFVNKMQDHSDSPEALEMHNTFLGILVQSGIFGFISFLAFLALLFIKATKKYFKLKSLKYKGYLSMIVLGLISNFIYTLVQFGFRSRHMWLGFALIVAIIKCVENEKNK